MRYLAGIVLTTSLFATPPSGVYLELDGGSGLNTTQKTESGEYKYDKGGIASFALGYQIEFFRVELEGEYKYNKIYSFGNNNQTATGDLTRESKMFNVYYSGYNESKLVSTIGLGAGLSDIKSKDLLITSSNNPSSDFSYDNIFTYQGSFSIGYMVTKHITTQIKYKYIATTKQDDLKENSDNIFSFGIRYLF